MLFSINQYKTDTEINETHKNQKIRKNSKGFHTERSIFFLEEDHIILLSGIQFSSIMWEQASDLTMVLAGHFTLKEK